MEVEAKLVGTNQVRVDTTVVEADVAYPTDSGLLVKAIGTMGRTVARIKAARSARDGWESRWSSATKRRSSITPTGSAPNSPASMAPEPSADTASLPR